MAFKMHQDLRGAVLKSRDPSRPSRPQDLLATDSSVASRLLFRFSPLAPRPVPNSHPDRSLARASRWSSLLSLDFHRLLGVHPPFYHPLLCAIDSPLCFFQHPQNRRALRPQWETIQGLKSRIKASSRASRSEDRLQDSKDGLQDSRLRFQDTLQDFKTSNSKTSSSRLLKFARPLVQDVRASQMHPKIQAFKPSTSSLQARKLKSGSSHVKRLQVLKASRSARAPKTQLLSRVLSRTNHPGLKPQHAPPGSSSFQVLRVP